MSKQLLNMMPEAHGFEEVPLETIFDHIKSTAKVKNFERETVETKTCTLPGLSATNTNNGFGFYLNENEHTPLSNCITVSANGINTGYAAYQGGKFGISQDAYALKFKDISGTKRQYLYFTGVLNKNNEVQYDYTTKAGWKRLSQDLVKVPVTREGKIDWEYMENYIKTIECKYIDQIAQVNAREQEILKQLYPEAVKVKPEAHGFGEVPLETIFDHIKSTAKVKNFEKETVETKTCTLPGLSATNTNNGFGFYLNENEHTPLSNCITVSANGINTGYAAYQGGKFGISQDSYALKLKDISGTKRQYLYFTGVLNKNNEIQYDYTTKAGWKRLSQDLVKVPVTSAGDIDWEYMENYIAWIETQERERVESYVRHARRKS